MFVFAEITPRWPAASDPIRVCNATDRRAQTWDGERWAAGIVDPGQIVVDLFSGEFGGEIGIGIPAMSITTREMEKLYPASKSVRWESADVRIWAGEFTGAAGVGSYPYANDIALLCEGQVSKFEKEGDKIKLRVDPQDRADRTNVLTLEYAGTGGAEGGADKKGTLKPWVFGYAKNVEPILINEDDNIYQFSGYGPIQAISALYEKASSFGASFGDYANYAALLAAAVPEGRWATCLAEGLIKLGAPQYGVITGDVQGHLVSGVCIRKTGAILSAIAVARGLPVNAASMTALDAFGDTLPGDAHISLVLTEQSDVLSLARRLCAPLNAQAGVSLLGELFAVRINLASPTFTLESRGKRLPLVSGFSEADTPPPFKKIVMGADPSWRVHNLSSEVAFFATLLEVGIYDAGTVYREGNIASIADGSRWLYVNPTATSGNAPFDSSVYWERLSAAATGPAGADGADGVSPPLITLSTTHNTFRYDADDAPLAQTTTLKATRQNTAGVTEWRILESDGTPQTSWLSGAALVTAAGVDSSPDNDTLVLNQARFEANIDTYGSTGLIFEARISTATGVQDRVSIIKVRDGDNAITAYLTNEAQPLGSDAAGNIFSYDGAEGEFKIEKGGVDISGAFTLSTASNPQVLTIGYTGMTYEVTAGFSGPADNATVTIRATGSGAYAGVTIDKVFSLSKSKTGAGGAAGAPGADGADGADGAPGSNNAVVKLYKRAATSPAAPTGTFTYTFATGVLSGGTLDGWSQADPADNGLPKWVIAAVASSPNATDSIPAAEFSSPVIDQGSGTKAVPLFLYRRSVSAPATPTVTLTYTFADNSLAGDLEGAVRSIADTTGTDPVWVRQAVATGTGATDSIAAGEWSAWEQVFANGAAGLTPITATASPPAISVPCTFNGTPKAAVPGFQITVVQGTTDRSAVATYGTVTAVGISGAAVDSDGTVTVTGILAEGTSADPAYVELAISYGGSDTKIRVNYVKVRDGNAAVSGSASVTSLTNGGTYASSANFNISLANGQTFNANASVAYFAASSTYTSQMKLAYVNVTDGGAETDMAGSEATGGSATSTEPETNSTTGSFTNSSGGTKVFNIRLLTRRSAGAGNSTSVTGTVGGSG